MSRRFFLGGGVTLAAGAALAAAPSVSLRPKSRPSDLQQRAVPAADRLFAEAGISGALGYAVIDVKSGLVLEERAGDTGLPPASVTKSITALYALNALGADYRFTTQLQATGSVSGGVLKGDLILLGGGDPTLDTDALAAMAAKLKAAGVTQVSGRFLVNDSTLPEIKRIDGDQPDHVGYNPALSGLNLNFNRVHFEWRRASNGSYAVAMDARSDKYRPAVRMASMAVANRDIPVYTYKDRGGADEWTVAKTALGNAGSRWLPVRQPALYAGEVFRELAAAQGIKLTAPERSGKSGRSALVSHRSEPLVTILRDMLKYSNNLTAEVVGLTATAARTGRAPSLQSSASDMSSWARSALGMGQARFVDHSGLGEASRVSAGEMARAMALVGRNNALRPILKPIPMRDANGNVIKGHPIKVEAKTGTLNFVSTLSGYMTARDGTELAFAIFSADLKRRAAIPKAQRERPDGAGVWNRNAKRLQQKLIERWDTLYGA